MQQEHRPVCLLMNGCIAFNADLPLSFFDSVTACAIHLVGFAPLPSQRPRLSYIIDALIVSRDGGRGRGSSVRAATRGLPGLQRGISVAEECQDQSDGRPQQPRGHFEQEEQSSLVGPRLGYHRRYLHIHGSRCTRPFQLGCLNVLSVSLRQQC